MRERINEFLKKTIITSAVFEKGSKQVCRTLFKESSCELLSFPNKSVKDELLSCGELFFCSLFDGSGIVLCFVPLKNVSQIRPRFPVKTKFSGEMYPKYEECSTSFLSTKDISFLIFEDGAIEPKKNGQCILRGMEVTVLKVDEAHPTLCCRRLDAALHTPILYLVERQRNIYLVDRKYISIKCLSKIKGSSCQMKFPVLTEEEVDYQMRSFFPTELFRPIFNRGKILPKKDKNHLVCFPNKMSLDLPFGGIQGGHLCFSYKGTDLQGGIFQLLIVSDFFNSKEKISIRCNQTFPIWGTRNSSFVQTNTSTKNCYLLNNNLIKLIRKEDSKEYCLEGANLELICSVKIGAWGLFLSHSQEMNQSTSSQLIQSHQNFPKSILNKVSSKKRKLPPRYFVSKYRKNLRGRNKCQTVGSNQPSPLSSGSLNPSPMPLEPLTTSMIKFPIGEVCFELKPLHLSPLPSPLPISSRSESQCQTVGSNQPSPLSSCSLNPSPMHLEPLTTSMIKFPIGEVCFELEPLHLSPLPSPLPISSTPESQYQTVGSNQPSPLSSGSLNPSPMPLEPLTTSMIKFPIGEVCFELEPLHLSPLPSPLPISSTPESQYQTVGSNQPSPLSSGSLNPSPMPLEPLTTSMIKFPIGEVCFELEPLHLSPLPSPLPISSTPESQYQTVGSNQPSPLSLGSLNPSPMPLEPLTTSMIKFPIGEVCFELEPLHLSPLPSPLPVSSTPESQYQTVGSNQPSLLSSGSLNPFQMPLEPLTTSMIKFPIGEVCFELEPLHLSPLPSPLPISPTPESQYQTVGSNQPSPLSSGSLNPSPMPLEPLTTSMIKFPIGEVCFELEPLHLSPLPSPLPISSTPESQYQTVGSNQPSPLSLGSLNPSPMPLEPLTTSMIKFPIGEVCFELEPLHLSPLPSPLPVSSTPESQYQTVGSNQPSLLSSGSLNPFQMPLEPLTTSMIKFPIGEVCFELEPLHLSPLPSPLPISPTPESQYQTVGSNQPSPLSSGSLNPSPMPLEPLTTSMIKFPIGEVCFELEPLHLSPLPSPLPISSTPESQYQTVGSNQPSPLSLGSLNPSPMPLEPLTTSMIKFPIGEVCFELEPLHLSPLPSPLPVSSTPESQYQTVGSNQPSLLSSGSLNPFQMPLEPLTTSMIKFPIGEVCFELEPLHLSPLPSPLPISPTPESQYQTVGSNQPSPLSSGSLNPSPMPLEPFHLSTLPLPLPISSIPERSHSNPFDPEKKRITLSSPEHNFDENSLWSTPVNVMGIDSLYEERAEASGITSFDFSLETDLNVVFPFLPETSNIMAVNSLEELEESPEITSHFNFSLETNLNIESFLQDTSIEDYNDLQ